MCPNVLTGTVYLITVGFAYVSPDTKVKNSTGSENREFVCATRISSEGKAGVSC